MWVVSSKVAGRVVKKSLCGFERTTKISGRALSLSDLRKHHHQQSSSSRSPKVRSWMLLLLLLRLPSLTNLLLMPSIHRRHPYRLRWVHRFFWVPKRGGWIAGSTMVSVEIEEHRRRVKIMWGCGSKSSLAERGRLGRRRTLACGRLVEEMEMLEVGWQKELLVEGWPRDCLQRQEEEGSQAMMLWE